MTNLTWARDGAWGMKGVDLAALPPKIYGALFRLHELEHDREELVEQLAWMMGVDQWELQDKLERSPGPWHPVEELPQIFLDARKLNPSSRRLFLHHPNGSVGVGCCEIYPEGPRWIFSPPNVLQPDYWMEVPEVGVKEKPEDH